MRKTLSNKVILLMTVFLSVFALEAKAITFERGDALFSDGFLAWVAGHSMLYYKWDVSGDPSDPTKQLIIEAQRPGSVSRKTDVSGRVFWENSARTKGSLAWVQRKTIVERGEKLIGKKYPKAEEFLTKYKGPDKYRCDGLVEDCYEQAGIDIVPGDAGVTLAPRIQHDQMIPDSGQGPIINITNPAKTIATAKAVTIEASVSDVSGIGRVEFWDGYPSMGSLLAGESESDNASESKTYSRTYDLSGKSGAHNLYVKAYDGAGNSTISQGINAFSGIVPKVESIIPTELATEISLRPNIVAVFSGKMNMATIDTSSLKLFNIDNGSQIPGSVKYNDETNTSAFTPTVSLAEKTKYKFVVYASVKDTAGNSLDGNGDGKSGDDFVSSFSTGTASTLVKIIQLSSQTWNVVVGGARGMSVMSVKASGTGDNIINQGETVELTLTLTNTGSETATSVSGILTSPSGVNLTAGTQTFGSIAPGESAVNSSKYVFSIPPTFVGSEILFNLAVSGQISGGGYSDKITFRLPVGTTFLTPPGWSARSVANYGFLVTAAGKMYAIDDKNKGKVIGNGNGAFDEGDRCVNLVFYAGNNTSAKIAVTFTLKQNSVSGSSNTVVINDDPGKSLEIPPYSYVEIPYNISLGGYLSDSAAIPLIIQMEALGQKTAAPFLLQYTAAPEQAISIASTDPPDVFSPNGDGNRDVVTLKFIPLENIKESISLLVRKRNEDGSYGDWNSAHISASVKNYGESFYANKEYWVKWENGGEYSDGRYELQVSGWSLLLNEDTYIPYYYTETYRSNPVNVLLHKTAPQAEKLEGAPKFSPFNPALPGHAALSYYLTLNADALIKVKNAAGDVVDVITDEKLSAPGSKEYVFQSYDSNNNILPDGKYTFNLRLDDHANTPESYARGFTIDHAPQDFLLVTTTTEAISPTKAYALFWTPASPYGPEWNHLKEYEVMGKKVGGTDDYGVLKGKISSTETSTTVNIPTDGRWQIKVRAIDREGNWRDSDGTNSAGYVGDPTRLLTVNVDATPPLPFWISYPWQDGQKFDAHDVPITWDEARDVNLDHYELIVGTDPNDLPGSAIYSNSFSAAATREVWLKDLARGKYYMFMIAYDKAGHWRRLDGKTDRPEYDKDLTYAYKDKWPMFEVGTIPPETFSFAAPYDGRIFDGVDVKIAWNPAEDTNLDRYELTVGTKETDVYGSAVFAATFEASASREGEVKELKRGIYYTGIIAFDADGNWRDLKGKTNLPEFSKNARTYLPSFEIDPIPPGAFSVSNIYNGQYFDSRNVKIAWNEAVDKELARYELYVGKDKNNIIGTAVYAATREASAARECLVNLPGGIYWIYLRAYDKLGNFRGLDGRTNAPEHDLDLADNIISFEIDHAPPTVRFDNVSFLPLSNPHFSPNNDGVKDATAIRFGVVDDAYYKDFPGTTEVKVEIVNSSGEAVGAWKYPAFTALPGWVELPWDGTLMPGSPGTLAPDGSYTVRITVTDKALNTATDESQTVVVDTTPPEIKNVANTGVFSPNGDGKFDTDTLNFDLNDNLFTNLTASVEVIDDKGSIIGSPSLTKRGGIEGGELVAVTWDGARAPDGTYQYRITSTDQAGNTSTSLAAVTIDTAPPAFSNVSTFPKKEVGFTENSGRLDLNFSVSEPANVNLVVYDSNYSVIRDYLYTVEAGAANVVSWDGKDTFGSFVPDNTYISYAFSATDRAANSSNYNPVDMVKVDTPVTGLAGNILYSPDGAVKIIVPAGAVPTGLDLVIDEDEKAAKTFKVQNKDNITKIYRFGRRGESGEIEHLNFKKSPILVMRYDASVLNYLDQPIELWRSGSAWIKVNGSSTGNLYNAYLDTTSEFALFGDLTPPAAPTVSPSIFLTKNTETAVLVESEPYSKVDLYLNGQKRAPPLEVGASGTFLAKIILAEGINTLTARATDQTGNSGSTSETVTIKLDTTPPELTLVSPQTIYTNDEAAISCAASAYSTIIISVKDNLGNVLQTGSELQLKTNNLHLAADGSYPYLIKAFDALGNEARKTGTIIVDRTKPEALLQAEPTVYATAGILALSGIAEDTNFDRYVLESGAGAAPSTWTEIKQGFVPINYQKLSDFDTKLLTDGVYTFRLTAYDRAGNSKSSSLTKLIINSELAGTVLSPVRNQVIRGTVNVQGEIHGSNFAEYRVEYGAGANPAAWAEIASSTALPIGSLLSGWETTKVPDGIYTLRLKVINLGNRSTYYALPVAIDNTLPTLVVGAPSDGAVLGGTITIEGQTYDTNFKSYKVEQSNGGSWSLIKSSNSQPTSGTLAVWNSSGLAGAYVIKITAEDQAGNISASSINMTVDNGVADSSLAITSPGQNKVIRGTVEVIGRATDENFKEYKVEYGAGDLPPTWTTIGTTHTASADSGGLESWDTKSVSDGGYALKLAVLDLAGNSKVKVVPVIVDNSNPAAKITWPLANNVLGGTITISGEAADLHFSKYKVEYGQGANPADWMVLKDSSYQVVSGKLADWNTLGLNGTYTLRLTVSDEAGNIEADSVTFIVDNGVLSSAAVITAPLAAEILGGPIKVSGVAYDDNFKEYKLEYGEGQNPATWGQIGGTNKVGIVAGLLGTWETIGLDGAYTIKLTVTDLAENNNSNSVSVIVDNTKPEVNISFPSPGNVLGGTIEVVGGAADNHFASYKVEFGAGANPSDWSLIHFSTVEANSNKLASWNTAGLNGSYTIKLTAVDQVGNTSSKTVTLTIDNVVLPETTLIKTPLTGSILAKTVEIYGQAYDENFQEYKVEYGVGANPAAWTTVGTSHAVAVAEGALENWNTASVADGSYTLRLTVEDLAGNSLAYTASTIVDNTNPAQNISYPLAAEVLGGSINISGTISDANFQEYLVEYGANPATWNIIQGPFYGTPEGSLAVWNTGSFNGNYTIRLTSTDQAGNSSSTQTVVTVDNTNPSASLSFPQASDILGGAIGISGTAADPHFANYKLEYGLSANPVAWTTITFSDAAVSNGQLGSWNTSALGGDGIYTVRLSTADQAGNTSEAKTQVVIDNTGPTAAITFPTQQLVVADAISILGTAIDEAHFEEYKVEYGPGTDPVTWGLLGSVHFSSVFAGTLESWDTTAIADGPYTLKLSVKDVVFNTSVGEKTVIVDNTYPTVLLANPASGSYLAGPVNISGTIADANLDHYILDYRPASSAEGWQAIAAVADGQNISNGTINNWPGAAFLDGNYIIRARAYDQTGKISSAEVSVTLDNTSPTVTLTSPSPESVSSGTVNFSGEISDLNFAQYAMKYGYGIQPTQWWNLTSGSSGVLPPSSIVAWNTLNVKDGYYTVRLEAQDKAGNTNSFEYVLTIDNSPPIAAIHSPSVGAVVRGTISLEGIACDADFTTYNFKKYEISVGAGLVPAQWTTLESLVVPRINEVLTNWNTAAVADGTYTLKLRSSDISGVTEDTKTVVVDNTLPTLSISSPSQGQTVGGSVNITGTASDVNFAEYKISYKLASDSNWTEIAGGPSSPSPLGAWSSGLVGDGQYVLKLWVKDKAGNEREVINEVTVNNVLAVVNDSTSPATISPNGDGIDDIAKIAYTLSESSPVTVKIYKKPQYDTFKWEAKGYGTRYPIQKFDYTINALGTNHPNQPFTYTLSASGTQHPLLSFTYTLSAAGTMYPPQDFNWKVDASGTETWGQSGSANPSSSINTGQQKLFVNGGIYKCDGYKVYYNVAYPTALTNNVRPDVTCDVDNPTYTSYAVDGTDNNTTFFVLLSYNASGFSVRRLTFDDLNSDSWFYGKTTNPISWSVSNSNTSSVSASDPPSGSKKATINHNGTITGNSYSVTLSPINGGIISGHTISFSQTSDTDKATASRDGSGWSGNTLSGVINASYIYPGSAWSGSSGSQAGSCNSWSGGNYTSPWTAQGKVVLDSYVEGASWSLSALSDSNVSLKFEDGKTSTSNGNQKVVASTSYTTPWNPSYPNQDGSCRSGPGNPANYEVLISSKIQSLPEKTDGISYSLSGLDNSKVSLRFSGTNTQTTSNYGDKIIGSTSFAQAWSGSSGGANSCNALGGTVTMPETMSSKFGAPNTNPDYREYSGFSVANNNSNISLRFNGSGLTSTNNPSDYLIASTSYSEPWDSSQDPAVLNSGWIKSGEAALPFNYDESSQALSANYTPPSDVVLSSWTVNLKNPADGTSADVALDGTPSAAGNFKVKIADSLLIKTLQNNTATASGAQAINWDGKDAKGNYVADGDYLYYLYAGPNIVKRSGVVKVQRSSEISASSISDSYLSPNGDGIKETAAINYTLTENAAVVIEVTNEAGAIVKSFSAPGNQGANSSAWDGKNGSGEAVEDGAYMVRIKATYANGALRIKELKVIVDRNSLTAVETPAQKLASGGSDPVYSPDKSKIAYVKEVSGKKQVFSLALASSQLDQLTNVGNNFQPAWSPDGAIISLTSDRSGNNDVWVMDSNGGEQKQITADNASETSPAFSPDGQKISYASNRTGKVVINKWNIWTTGLNGKNPTQVTADDNTAMDDSPSYSPDGKNLIYASDQAGNFDLWTINLDGSVKTQMTSSSEAETSPAWSPDGLKVAQVRGSDIYLERLATSEEVKVAAGANPAWSKDGTEILFNTASGDLYSKRVCAGTLTGVITQPILDQTLNGLVEIRGTALDTNFESYKLEFSPNTLPYAWTELKNASAPVSNGILGAWNSAAASDGEYILRLTVNDKAGNSLQNTVVVIADNDNWKLTITSSQQLTSHEAWDIEPVWSPDGKKLAFSSNRSGNYDLWTMNSDGSGLQNLTNDPAYDDKPAWSPDGTKLAFVSDRSGNKDIWVADANGTGNPQQLTDLTIVDTDPTWSPDGSKIAFASNRADNFDLWAVNSTGAGVPIKLTSSEAEEREPSWSQFGLAYTSNISGNKEIWLIQDINNPNPFRLTSSEAEDKEPCWAPLAIPLSDGSRPLLTFTSTRNGNQDIYVMDTDGIDQSKSLTDYTNVDCNPAWSPDGTKVAYASYKDGQYDLWVMTFGINTTALSVRSQQSTQKPRLQKPTSDSKVETIRPTFEWLGVQGITDYRVELGKTSTWVTPTRKLIKTISQTEAATSEPSAVYAIHEFDAGLDRGDWYWKVIAVAGTQETVSEDTWRFTIEPDLALTGITNYPNPFSPNREKTKIRYKLGTGADEVKIRIYDITGSLVTELVGTTNGESSSIWSKYNDLEWDGRNGRGDVVMNGIYPFEVTARLGERSVSGRGKIAVLK